VFVCLCMCLGACFVACARAEKNHTRLCRSFARGAQLRWSSLEGGLFLFLTDLSFFLTLLSYIFVIVCSTQ
jgi:hypothetical protein